MSAPSNTQECFRELIGRTVVGVLFDVMPLGRRDLAQGTTTLILDDWTGLSIASNGSYWREDKADMDRAIGQSHALLKKLCHDLAAVMVTDGLLSAAAARRWQSDRTDEAPQGETPGPPITPGGSEP